MSGGSFNYLCHSWNLEDLIEKRSELPYMVDALAAEEAIDAARETEALRALLAQTEVRIEVALKRLTPVWKAMEWWRSGDYGEDQFRKALEEYRAS